jgi:DNA-binding LacI/PurR family transcriptional regulator
MSKRKSRHQVGAASGKRAQTPQAVITASDVARQAGVSLATVSRAFTKGASVASATRKLVSETAKSLGYRPNILARSLMTNRTELIGLITSEFENPIYLEILSQFITCLQRQGLRPLVVNLTEGLPANGALGILMQYKVDGVIVASSGLHAEFAKACAATGLPLVQAFGRPVGEIAANSVGADNYAGGRIAAELMCRHGYRKLAYLGGPENATSTIDRLKGFRERLALAGAQPVETRFSGAFSYHGGLDAMRDILRAGNVEAVFCGNDVMAMGALDACREMSISVPEQMGIMGFDDIPMASWGGYNLTTIRQPVGDIVATAVELMVSLIEGPARAAVAQLFSCVAVERETLRPLGRAAGHSHARDQA